jgi:hydrogenase nickel incorporation protein HypA/HybF
VFSFQGFVKGILMHEIKIAEDLSALVLETAKKENISKVTKVNIIFGQLIQIVPDIFRFAFEETVRNSVAEDAELIIEVLPVEMKCINCGNDFQMIENRFSCNVCNSTDLEIIHGKELFIKSIEGE